MVFFFFNFAWQGAKQLKHVVKHRGAPATPGVITLLGLQARSLELSECAPSHTAPEGTHVKGQDSTPGTLTPDGKCYPHSRLYRTSRLQAEGFGDLACDHA